MELLTIDEIQAQAILDMQLRRLAALERQKIIDDHDELEAMILDYTDILAKPGRQRDIISEELAEIVRRFGDDRRTQMLPFDGDMSMEDLIPEEDVVVTITRGGYAKRTRVDAYRSSGAAARVCAGRRCAARTWSTTSSRRPRTTGCCSSPTSAASTAPRRTSCRMPVVTARVSTSPTSWPSSPGRRSPRCWRCATTPAAPTSCWPPRAGWSRRPASTEYDSPRSGGLIAVNLRDGDELVGAGLAEATDDLLLVSRKGQSVRFHADDATLRPMGRATSGVTGMKFRGDDSLLSMSVVEAGTDPDVFVVFESGLAKRSKASEWNVKGRAILGVAVAKLSDKGGDLVGALTVEEDDEVLVIFEKGNIVRSRVDEVRLTGRNTMGVQFAKAGRGDSIVAVARNPEREVDEDAVPSSTDSDSDSDGDSTGGSE
jgi:DNA gyrase subunit A